ncbi:hypothetical protein RZS08_30160, partial [Arthrospira platensis SPKY1]|nr:hypothetical protein [Arthrospira platensis SPKY1]
MKICRYLELFIFAFWAVLLNGCAQNTHYSNLTYNKYSVCTLPHNADERWIASDKVDIYNIDAVIKDNQLVVSGNV